jgi:hypothetical protein
VGHHGRGAIIADRAAGSAFFLWRQTCLEECRLNLSQVSRRVAAEAQLRPASFLPLLQFAAQLPPARQIRRPELCGGEGLLAGRDCGHQAHRAPNYQARCGYLPARDAALMMARGAEEVLEVVVRPGQLWDLVALKEPEPVALGHGPEVRHRRRQPSGRRALVSHLGEQPAVGAPELVHVQAVSIREQVRGLVHPSIGGPNLGPQRGRGREPPCEQRVQPEQLGGEPADSTPRWIEVWIASRRS